MKIPFQAEHLHQLTKVRNIESISHLNAVSYVVAESVLNGNAENSSAEEEGISRNECLVFHAMDGEPVVVVDHMEEYVSYCWNSSGDYLLLMRRENGTVIDRWDWKSRTIQKVWCRTKLCLDEIRICPNDLFILVSANVFYDEESIEDSIKRYERESQSPIRTYDRLPIRTWNKDRFPNYVSHLLVCPIVDGVPSKQWKDLMKGMPDMAPAGFPWGSGFDISPCSGYVAYTSELDPAFSTGWVVRLVNVHTLETKILSSTSGNRSQDPLFSPNGKYLSYLRMNEPLNEADKKELILINLKTKQERSITEQSELDIAEYCWFQDNKSILFTAASDGEQMIFLTDIVTEHVECLVESGDSHSIRILNRDRIVFLQSHFDRPDEVFSFTLSKQKLQKITNYNQPLLDQILWSSWKKFYITGDRQDSVQCWMIYPAGFDEKKKYPAAFLIHGGPESHFSGKFHFRWNAQLWAARGYVVIIVNFHGSIGFGKKFTDSIRYNWGDSPLKDHLCAIEHLKKYEFIDMDRLCACGASYGGYLVNWIAAKTKCFKALASHSGIFSTKGMFYETDEPFFTENEFGDPRTSSDIYSKFNPMELGPSITTPMIILHGKKDYRVPFTQGLGLFTCLQRYGVPSKFVVMDNEDHWVKNTKTQIKWQEELLSFLDEHTKNDCKLKSYGSHSLQLPTKGIRDSLPCITKKATVSWKSNLPLSTLSILLWIVFLKN